MNKALFSSKKGDWETPAELFEKLDEEFGFDLDVCAERRNRKCSAWISPKIDALASDWTKGWETPPVCWMNPPYGRGIGKWIKKAKDAARAGCTVVCLLPARTDTRYFHDLIWDTENHREQNGVELRLLKGRLKFVGAKSSAPFPSMIVVFHPYLQDVRFA